MITLGIDTSNYTTSCAIVVDGNVVDNVKLPLAVENGKLGLRQSDAVFLHIRALPEAIAKLSIPPSKVNAVGVSSKPRSVDGSYMPCFLSGLTIAKVVAECLNVPIFETSHQNGHVYAAAYSAKMNTSGGFYSLHLSGGTLEILDVRMDNWEIELKTVAQTLDLTAGQLIDRVGQMLGLPFPSGAAVSAYAEENVEKIPKIKPCVKGDGCNLSGVYNMAQKLKVDGKSERFICAFVLDYINKTIDEMIENLYKIKKQPLLFCGGVSSSSVMRKYFEQKYSTAFAAPEYSSDNAAGCALYAYYKML